MDVQHTLREEKRSKREKNNLCMKYQFHFINILQLSLINCKFICLRYVSTLSDFTISQIVNECLWYRQVNQFKKYVYGA